MDITTANVYVRASAGEGTSFGDIPPQLALYCTVLQRLNPKITLVIGDPEADAIQLHNVAVAKGSSIDPNIFGVNVNWSPYIYDGEYHMVDPNDPGSWDPAVNGESVCYEVRVDGSSAPGPMLICVTTVPNAP